MLPDSYETKGSSRLQKQISFFQDYVKALQELAFVHQVRFPSILVLF
jgi:hypothetical protein